MALQINDFAESVSASALNGYHREHRIKGYHLVDLVLNSTLTPRSITVDASLRLESASTPEMPTKAI